MQAPIGIGVLSFAHGHVTAYVNVMKEFDDVKLIAGYDDNADRGRQICESAAMDYQPDIEGVLGNPEVQAVMIGSETSRHAELAVAAAQAGKHILLQKPMALSLEECDRIKAAVERAGVHFSMAFQMRHDPANIKMRELVQGGDIGKIGVVRRRHCIGVLFSPQFLEGPSHWHVEAEHNIGMFADDAAHPADWMHWVFGKPVSVMAEIDNILTDVAPDDNGAALYRFESGALGILYNGSTVQAAENTTEIYGDKGVIIQNYGDGPSCGVPRMPDGPALKIFRYGENRWEDLGIPIPEGHGLRIQGVPRPWVDSLVKELDPPATADDGKWALQMTLGAYESCRQGRRIALPMDA